MVLGVYMVWVFIFKIVLKLLSFVFIIVVGILLVYKNVKMYVE